MSARFKFDAVLPNAEYEEIVSVAKKHFYGTFATKCVGILYAVFKPIAVALQTNSVAEVRKAIEISRDQVETFYDLSLILASPGDELPLPISSSPSISPNAIQPTPEPYTPPREETEEIEVVDSGSSATSLYAGFEEDD